MVQEDSWWEKNRVTGLYQLGLDVDKILGQTSAHQKKESCTTWRSENNFMPQKIAPPPLHPPLLLLEELEVYAGHMQLNRRGN